jgi:flavin reductase (DIM6/NTAB) family NADH-FMN oxidoreductase RutF
METQVHAITRIRGLFPECAVSCPDEEGLFMSEGACLPTDGADLRDLSVSCALRAESFKEAFRALVSGVSVVSFDVGPHVHGFTATSLTSVSMNPPLALFCIDRNAASHAHMRVGKRIGFSFLAADQAPIAGAFATHTPPQGYGDLGIVRLDGAPAVAGAVAMVAASIRALHPSGDSTVCICALTAAQTVPVRPPLLYSARQYRRLSNQLLEPVKPPSNIT